MTYHSPCDVMILVRKGKDRHGKGKEIALDKKQDAA
jgi:hypothetical protein